MKSIARIVAVTLMGVCVAMLMQVPTVDCQDKCPLMVSYGQRGPTDTETARGTNVFQKKDGPAPGAGRKYALLVGCTWYPMLGEKYRLEGPANDVMLVRKTLMDNFGFLDKDIVTLSEEAAKTQGEMFRPTRKNIEREFNRLGKVAQAGDQVVTLLSGHGSLQPEPDPLPDPQYARPDGLNEVFLPADCDSWQRRQGIVNAIANDDFRIWTQAIVKNGAFLFFIADCCHSGTLVRGPEMLRQVKPEDLQIPKEVMVAAGKRAAARGKNRGHGDGPFHMDKVTGKLAAIYACRSSEATVELPLPRESPRAKPYGLLTYSLCQILIGSKSSLTYRELVQRIRQNYDYMDRDFPTPLVEGSGRDFNVLGTEKWPGRSQFTLSKKGSEWQINGGFLHQFTPNSIFAVYPPSGTAGADKVVGHVQITEVGPFTAVVKPCKFGATPLTDKMTPGSRCEPAFLDFGSLRLRVALDTVDQHGTPLPAQLIDGPKAMLEQLAQEKGSLIEIVNSIKADWLLRPDKQGIYLLPARGVLHKIGDQELLFGPLEANPKDATAIVKLKDQLARIARVVNLRRLAQPLSAEDTRDVPLLKVEILQFANKQDKVGKVAPVAPDLTFRDGDIIAFRITHPKESNKMLYVSLLYLDAGYKIEPLYPRPDEIQNPLLPGKFVQTRRLTVNAPWGLESVLAIAVPANKDQEPLDFTVLSQRSLMGAREGVRGARALDTPLGLLLQNACYGKGERGASMLDIDDHVLQLLSWQALPGK